VLEGSPISDRGRRPKRRLRTKTATQRDQDGLLAEDSTTGDGDGEGGVDGDGEDEEEEEEFSDMLADAILKRPESIRDGSLKSTKKDSRGKAVHVDGTAAKDLKKGEVNLNDHGNCGGEREGEDGDGWIMGPCVNASRTIISVADSGQS
jgi:hypothetical protein